MEEERRLFYVAITRAKDKLVLISEKGNESSFIDEIPEEFLFRTTDAMQSTLAKVILCENCSAQLEAGWVACPHCGKRVIEL